MSELKKSGCGSAEKCGESYIHGVYCDVKTCMYHDSVEHCTAKKISIGPSFASTSNDTICSTFKPKK